MKHIIVFTILLFGTNVFAHGFIEKINCESTSADQHIYFYGHEVTINEGDSPFKLHFMLYSEGIGVVDFGVREFTLKDISDGQNVIEKITINFKDQGFAELLIPEVYSEKNRTGEGRIQLQSDIYLNANLSCIVLYE